jgi:hypothetical protein
MTDNDQPTVFPTDPKERHDIRVAAWIVGLALLVFAFLAIFMFVFRWQLLGDPWKII